MGKLCSKSKRGSISHSDALSERAFSNDINGIDTETVNGLAVIMANKDIACQVKSWKNCADFMFVSGKILWLYNLDYDVQAMLKYLPWKLIEYLYIHTQVSYQGYKIDYLRGKYFRIRHLSRSLECYDALPFYQCSLEKAASLVGEKGKHKISKKIIRNLGKYLADEKIRKRVMKYCQHDAYLAYTLGLRIMDSIDNCKIKTKYYFSPGFIAKKFLQQPAHRLSLSDEDWKFLHNCYHGGRIETVQRGYFPVVYVYDINSAYPAQYAKLPSLEKAILRTETFIGGDFSFIHAKVTYKNGLKICPFTRTGVPNDYPFFSGQDVYFTSLELESAKPYIADMEILESKNLYIFNKTLPYEQLVHAMYQRRLHGTDAEKFLYKLILNSMYGITAERRGDYKRLTEPQEHVLYKQMCRSTLVHELKRVYNPCWNFWECKCEKCLLYKQAVSLYPTVKHPVHNYVDTKDGIFVKEKNRLGHFYNIVYAALITAGTRAAVYRAVEGYHEHIVAFLTDGIISTQPLSLPLSSKMGEFNLKNVGKDACVVGSGVYEYTKDDGNIETKFRGYDTKIKLRKLLKSSKDKIKIKHLQNISIGLICKQKRIYDTTDLNLLIDYEKELDINFDKKRFWAKPFKNGLDALKNNIISNPLTINK